MTDKVKSHQDNVQSEMNKFTWYGGRQLNYDDGSRRRREDEHFAVMRVNCSSKSSSHVAFQGLMLCVLKQD